MTIGICAYDMAPDELVELAVAADELGFAGLWIGEHLVAPVSPTSVHPTSSDDQHAQLSKPIVDPAVNLLDPWVVLSAIASRTTRIELGTAIYLLPLRHPLLTARAGASLAQLSGGRLRLGIGVGWLKEEFDAFGRPFDTRGRDTDEILQILERAWSGGPFGHAGDAWVFDEVQVVSAPVDVPIVIGGNSPPAFRRACQRGDAWFASGTPSFEEALRLHDELRDVESRSNRNRPLPAYVRMQQIEPELVPKYEAAGIEHQVLWNHVVWNGATANEREQNLARTADRFGLQPRKETVT